MPARMAILLYILLGLVGVFLLAFMLLGRSSRTIARGRFSRLARIGRLGTRLWTSWLGAKLRRLFQSKERRARYDEERRRADAEAVTRTMGQMKGAFMKIGQMLSFISDAIPAEYRVALQSLQTEAPPMDFAMLRDVAERELGRPLERAFASFDVEPLAAASIGQVHRARLASGEEVAVKIQYPGVAEAIRSDLRNAGVLNRMVATIYPALEPGPFIEELRARVFEEFDYRIEARNQAAFRDLYAGHPFIRVPRVIESHSTERVLTSEFVAGRSFADILAADPDTQQRCGEILYRFVHGSISRFGVFNGDPHPGNYLYDDDGRVVFLDFGCVKYFPEEMLGAWDEMVKAHLSARPDEFRAKSIELGFIKAETDIETDVLYDYFGYYYEPFSTDRDYTFTREYNSKSLTMVMRPGGRFAGIEKQLNMPPDFVFVNRIHWGAHSILGQLEARANWYRIQREYMYGEPPATKLGELDRDYRAAWLRERELSGRLILRPDGVKARSGELSGNLPRATVGAGQ